ncbi:MAG: hypothetical protein KME20_26610 [Kaiparowitsia implicata GSE-PSE-MK54-09C]|jgi:hypothetical protein|nr:hypothetical protein [Kaiparowitsia implicata GSE-PSE-MK54-09C]
MDAFLVKSLISGSVVSGVTTAVLALLARVGGGHPVQPVNSTSHWYWGEAAGRSRAIDLGHTLLGFATHHGASVFWAGVYQAIRRVRPERSVVVDAVGVSAIAALVDYGLVPKRLTPGWEKVVAPSSIAIAYVAMAVALWATSPRDQPEDDGR